MTETVDLNTYMSYVLIAAYYVIMLRLWLPPPPSAGGKEPGDDKAVVADGASSRAALRRMAPSLAGDDGEPALSTAPQPDEPLERIRAADEHFDEMVFLSGASQVYELVVNAYAKGDTAILDDLLDAEAAEAFGKAIDERQEKGESLMIDFIGIRELDIADAWLETNRAEITVRFVAELVTVTRATDNTVVDGDPNGIVTVADLWTFARRVPSSNPNWKIVATDGS